MPPLQMASHRPDAERLDVALVSRGIAPTRERAQALIAAGLVTVDGAVADSAARKVTERSGIELLGPDHPWASRAGLKLDAALTAFNVDCHDRIALDSGASTGGFTSVLLARGVQRVYAVDVGHGQLLTSVATDPRVTVVDRTNLRTLESLPGPAPSLVTLDLSFISLRLVMPALHRLAPGAEAVMLFKPQFELGRKAVGQGGIVRDEVAARAAVDDFLGWAEAEWGCVLLSQPLASPVRGTKGNQEWLVHLRLGPARP